MQLGGATYLRVALGEFRTLKFKINASKIVQTQVHTGLYFTINSCYSRHPAPLAIKHPNILSLVC